jgi:hypothetical protein
MERGENEISKTSKKIMKEPTITVLERISNPSSDEEIEAKCFNTYSISNYEDLNYCALKKQISVSGKNSFTRVL